MKKYAHSILRYFTIYALGFSVLYILRLLADVIYGILSDSMPSVFPSYNALTDKAETLALEATISLICAVITVFAVTFLAVKYDNGRFEFVISKTDGFYTIREGCAIYAKNYLSADVVSAVLVPVPFFLMTLVELPDGNVKALRILGDIIGTIAAPTLAFSDKLGFGFGLLAAASVSLLSRIPAVYAGLKRWRGLWLSDVDRQD